MSRRDQGACVSNPMTRQDQGTCAGNLTSSKDQGTPMSIPMARGGQGIPAGTSVHSESQETHNPTTTHDTGSSSDHELPDLVEQKDFALFGDSECEAILSVSKARKSGMFWQRQQQFNHKSRKSGKESKQKDTH